MTVPHAAPRIYGHDSAATVLRARAEDAAAHVRSLREDLALVEAETRELQREPQFWQDDGYLESVQWAPAFHEAHEHGLRRLADGEPLEDVLYAVCRWPGLDGHGDDAAEMLELIYRGVVRDHGPVEVAT